MLRFFFSLENKTSFSHDIFFPWTEVFFSRGRFFFPRTFFSPRFLFRGVFFQKQSYRCAMEPIDATLLLNMFDDIGTHDFGDLLSDEPDGPPKIMCKSCKQWLCKECFDADKLTCRGCLRVRRTYQRRKRKERLINANQANYYSSSRTGWTPKITRNFRNR